MRGWPKGKIRTICSKCSRASYVEGGTPEERFLRAIFGTEYTCLKCREYIGTCPICDKDITIRDIIFQPRVGGLVHAKCAASEETQSTLTLP